MQEFAATVRGALVDLAWKEPGFDPSTRELVGYEIFRDDTSTRPPSRRTWKTMPSYILESRGLEILPQSEYGVQPIWRIAAGGPPAVIEYGPPRLARDMAGTRQVMLPPEERIHSLSWLQHDGLITSDELDLAVEQLLGGRPQPVPVPLPEPEASPELAARISRAAAGGATPARRRRVLFAYIAVAAALILVAAVAAPLIGRALFAQPAAVHTSPTPTPVQPSPSPSPTPIPTVAPLNLQAILIKPTDLRAGYVAGASGSDALCSTCVPASYSLSVVLQNGKLSRSIVTGASVAPTADDAHSVVMALTKFRSAGPWTKGNSLGDESYFATSTAGARTTFNVVWRSRVMTEEIVLSAPRGTLTLQNAIDLAKVQQARAAAALAHS